MRKTSSVEEDRLETDARSARSDIDETDRYKAFRVPADEKVPILLQYCVTVFKAVAPQLQLWHPHWPMCPDVPWLLHFLSNGNAVPVAKQIHVWITSFGIQTRVFPCISTSSSIKGSVC
jgi:hypothetical protein